jgi:iron complex outermembrane receptor protein
MNMMKNCTLVFLFFAFGLSFSMAQSYEVSGTVKDKSTQEVLAGASIWIKSTQLGTSSDQKGQFHLQFSAGENAVLMVSYIGYQLKEIKLSEKNSRLNIEMEKKNVIGEEVVISASRVSERILKSPVSVQKVNAVQLQSSASGDFYKSLDNMKDVDMITNNIGFQTFNSRGFNSTQPYRVMQFIDGMDNQSVGLNFSPGNMFGASDIDLDNIEIISGPASALYGPNAFQGVLSMHTKDPFDHQGITVKLKGGTRQYSEGQIRIAEKLGKKEKFAFKVVASYFQGNDWPADDEKLNRYRVMPASPQNINAMVDSASYPAFYQYIQSYDSAAPGAKSFMLPGYMEGDMTSLQNDGLKLHGLLAYRPNNDLEASYGYYFSKASGVFQGNNRARLQNFIFQQHKLEIHYRNLHFKAYTTIDNSNESFDLGLTGINLGMAGLPGVSQAYLDGYVASLSSLTNGFTTPFNYATMYTAADQAGMNSSNAAWLQPGTDMYNAVLQSIITNSSRPQGSQYPDYSNLRHLELSYDKHFKIMDVVAGVSFRKWNPNTNGMIFSDTNNTDISFYEIGAYTQASKSFMDDKLKFVASVRFDKSQNYDMQFSPRAAVVYTLGKHHFRLSGQSAFRSPTLNDQYFLLNIGPLIVKGNVMGYDNLYTFASVNAYAASGNTDDLQSITLDPIRPEHINTLEFGYRSQMFDKLFTDIAAYYNVYHDFIGSVRAVEPKSGQAGEISGVNDIQSRNYNVYSIYANTSTQVKTFGASIGLKYYILESLKAYANCTYAKMQELDASDPLVPAFNTPAYKINVGLEAINIYKKLGFSLNYKWVDSYLWESVFATGDVDAFSNLDLQIHYTFEKLNSDLRIGGSNILGKEYARAYGAPGIGSFFYASWTYHLNDLIK